MMRRHVLMILLGAAIVGPMGCARTTPTSRLAATKDDGSWFILKKEMLDLGAHHQRHLEVFGPSVAGTYNEKVLEAIDRVQATAMDGGGYFIGVKADPPESPIGYNVTLFGQPLLEAPRTTSYCSGASYTAFIESLNLIYPNGATQLSWDRAESLRMQELDGSRREDRIKFWGKWNDDGFGSHYALVQYSGMGVEVEPVNARPGDFMNITWANGGGHAVVFLGWKLDVNSGEKGLLYWSSQRTTNGLGDQLVPLERIRHVKVVRMTKPDNLFKFDVETPVERRIPGDKIAL
jgi:hypothetical protein